MHGENLKLIFCQFIYVFHVVAKTNAIIQDEFTVPVQYTS